MTRKGILETIVAEFSKLPPTVKVMITSRDEHDIRGSLQDCSKELSIDEADNTLEDIACYMRYRLTSIPRRPRLLDWPGYKRIRGLVNRSGRLFVWASVACNFVAEKRNPGLWLDRLLETGERQGQTVGSPLNMLDILYTSILRNAFPDENDALIDFRLVVGSILALENPLTPIELDSLLGIGDGAEENLSILQHDREIPLLTSDEIVSPLRSILRVDCTSPRNEGPLRLLHPSLYEFLTNRADERFRIEPMEHNRALATRCMSIMNHQLKFDICQIGSPPRLNKDVENLAWRIKKCVPDGLRYSCRSFSYHIVKVVEPDAELMDALKIFLSQHILHWVEVMSLLGEITKAESCLHNLKGWIKDHGSEVILQAILEESIALLRNFGQGIRRSALHTYFSALALIPKTSILFRHFADKVPCIPDITSSHLTSPPASVRILEGHSSVVNFVHFSPDGTTLMSASCDWTVRLWDVDSGQPIGQALHVGMNRVVYTACSPDGRKVALVESDNAVQLWDIERGKSIGTLDGHTNRVRHVAFSPDGKKLASASDDRTVQIWDAESGAAIGTLEGHTDRVICVAFSPDGKKLASASYDMTVRMWDTDSGEAMGALDGHTNRVYHVEFSPNGNKLASASDDETVRIWDVESGAEIAALEGHASWVRHVTFSPDGKKLASASDDKTVRIWDVQSGAALGVLTGHNQDVRHVAFSPDGNKLVSASNDSLVRIWDVESGTAIGGALHGQTWQDTHVAFSPDGNKLACAPDDTTVQIWDINSRATIGEALKSYSHWISHVPSTPHGNKLASASDDKVHFWNAESGVAMATLEGHTNRVRYVAFSPDGNRLASASDDQTVRVWDTGSGAAIGALKGHTSWVQHVVFSPDGRKLASASDDKTARIWDAQSGAALRVLTGHDGYVLHVAFSPDGNKLVSASDDKKVRIWDVESGAAIGPPLEGRSNFDHRAIFSPDGTKLASASDYNMVRIWDAENGVVIGALKGHTNWVRHVVFSLDGKKLASTSDDKTVRIWDVESGAAMRVLKGQTNRVRHVEFSPDGNKLASASDDNKVRIWDVESGQLINEAFDPYADNIWNPFWPRDQCLSASNIHNPFHVADFIVNTLKAAMDFDEQGFLRCGTARLLWLPPKLRGSIAVKLSVIAVGSMSGAVTIIRIPDHMLYKGWKGSHKLCI